MLSLKLSAIVIFLLSSVWVDCRLRYRPRHGISHRLQALIGSSHSWHWRLYPAELCTASCPLPLPAALSPGTFTPCPARRIHPQPFLSFPRLSTDASRDGWPAEKLVLHVPFSPLNAPSLSCFAIGGPTQTTLHFCSSSAACCRCARCGIAAVLSLCVGAVSRDVRASMLCVCISVDASALSPLAVLIRP
jgi:hypothetical protein